MTRHGTKGTAKADEKEGLHAGCLAHLSPESHEQPGLCSILQVRWNHLRTAELQLERSHRDTIMPAPVRRLATLLLPVMALFLAGCAATGQSRYSAVPAPIAEIASVPGAARPPIGASEPTPIRFWGDQPLPEGESYGFRAGPDGSFDYLSLSGGGINGAYGAGFLVGWTQSGKRPEFEVVTGISVGGIIAPLAFLGPAYDGQLQAVFATLAGSKTPNLNFIGALLGNSAIASNSQVLAAIRTIITPETLTAIGREHVKGRRLLIGTTNLDAQRPVIWDIGAIAVSQIPDRLELVQQVILASAALPGVYPPVLIDVRAAGLEFDELHVDGGVTQQIVLLPDGLQSVPRNANLYVITNGTIEPTAEPVNVTSLSILERALPTLLKYRGRADLALLTNQVERAGVSYQMTEIPPDFPQPRDQWFGGPEWLAALYQYGVESGLAGVWRRSN